MLSKISKGECKKYKFALFVFVALVMMYHLFATFLTFRPLSKLPSGLEELCYSITDGESSNDYSYYIRAKMSKDQFFIYLKNFKKVNEILSLDDFEDYQLSAGFAPNWWFNDNIDRSNLFSKGQSFGFKSSRTQILIFYYNGFMYYHSFGM